VTKKTVLKEWKIVVPLPLPLIGKPPEGARTAKAEHGLEFWGHNDILRIRANAGRERAA